MRIAEWRALAHQVIGEVGRGGETFTGGRAHAIGHGFETGRDELGHDRETIAKGIRRIEQRLLVFLVVLVVCQGLCLHQHHQPGDVAHDARALAAHQFGDIRISLLRHDRAAGAETIGDDDEAEPGIRPENELLGEP